MGRIGGVPGGLENGSRTPSTPGAPRSKRGKRRLASVALGAIVGGAFTWACLDGDAQPLVRTPADAAAPAPTGDATPPASACSTGGAVTLYYWPAQADAGGVNSIDFLFKVVNDTSAPIPLSSLAIRYYFTNELTETPQTSIYYAGECCTATRSGFTADVGVSLNALTPATATADHYLEVTFDAGAGALQSEDAVQVEVGFYAPAHDESLDQANDYSFVASAAGTQAEWDLCPTQCAQFGSCVMTVYENGALVWGTPP
jgi:hypothetical protein